MGSRFFILSLSLIFFLSSCGDDVTSINPDGDARYQLTFQGTWSQADHGTVPGNAHFTTIIGLTHNSAIKYFAVGSMASDGIEEVAETGGTSTASDEIDGYIDSGNGFSKLVVSMPGGPIPVGTGEFTVSEDRPYVSAASMIAPSPDWFVGIRDFKLFENGEWVIDSTFNIGMYDAGTEDGDQFSLDNPETSPQENISTLTEQNASSLANGTPGIESIGTVRLQLLPN